MNLRSRSKINPSFNMSSMTDMIFILLIFFLIMTTLIDPEKRNALKVDLPKSTPGAVTQKKIPKIVITADANYYVDDIPVTLEEMDQVLKGKLGEFDNPKVTLHADKSVSYEKVVNVMTIARDNKYNLILATKIN